MSMYLILKFIEVIFETKYSKMEQLKSVEDSFNKTGSTMFY